MNRLLPHDPALPQLEQALDPQAMACAFGAALRGLQVRTCRVDRVKYRPLRNCTVSYVLELHDEKSGRDFQQRVAARFCTGGDAARRYRNAVGRTTVASAAGPALLHLSVLDMLAHWVPNDAKLDALRLLHDDTNLRRLCLHKVVAALTGGRGRLIDHRMALIQYVPELRICARVDLRLQSRPGAPITIQTLYAKADVERRGAVMHTMLQGLYFSPAQFSGRLNTPQPVLWQEELGLHWQLAVPGIALSDVDAQVGPAASARVGEQLAALHATLVPPSHATTVGQLCQQSRQVAALLAQVEPAWTPLLTRLVDGLEAGERSLEHEAAVTLHGDLHPRNILVHGNNLAFIDLDNARRGPAVIELGAWVADALYRALLNGVALREAAPSWHAFLGGHAQACGRTANESLLAWSTAHNLLCQRAYRCVANLKPGRFEAVPALLALADSIVRTGSIDAAVTCELEAA